MSDFSTAVDATGPSAALVRRMYGSNRSEFPINWAFHIRRAFAALTKPLTRVLFDRKFQSFTEEVELYRTELEDISEREVIRRLCALRGTLSVDAPLSPEMRAALALMARLSHFKLGQDPFPSQIHGAAVLISGGLAEMETGAGKSLTAALAAGIAVLAGEQVHLITVNDYLANRDAEVFSPLYKAIGISVGLITREVPPDQRTPVYGRDLIYATNKEIAFDYLRNRILMGAQTGPIGLTLEGLESDRSRARRMTMKGLPFAIVDEADSVLVDECRTPLIISADGKPDPDWAHTALQLGQNLGEGDDFEIDVRERRVTLTVKGKKKLHDLGEDLGGVWRNDIRREQAARQAVSALNLFKLDEHYVINEDKVELVDEYTGRIAEDRALGDGLHQLLQAKENVTVTGQRHTQGRITYQRFFRRYSRVAGMTGTANEVASELSAIYGLRVFPIKPHHPSIRSYLPSRVFETEGEKWSAVAAETERLSRLGRPVLVATRTVKGSQGLSNVFTDIGLEHVVLSATQNAEEGDIIAKAGQAGQVTIATNMAGRGVDIELGEGVNERGGLQVILTERHEAGRIDRQVQGRCARQGDNGSVVSYLSWEDPLVTIFGDSLQACKLGGDYAFRYAQLRAERLHARARLDLLKQDQRRDEKLTFTGSAE